MAHQYNKEQADWLMTQERRVFVLTLNAIDVAEALGCSEERGERIIEEMWHNCDPLWQYVWNLVDECARDVPEDPIVELMDKAKEAEEGNKAGG